jgi:UDP-N-acetylmuramoylalanine--D-glutamate ligase
MAEAARAIRTPVHEAPDLPEAFLSACGLAQTGDVVLLSPACTSFDAYPNFEARGEEFRALVARMAEGTAR